MLVTLKTLQEETFTVEIDSSQTVRNFKEIIERVKGDEFPAKNMKLMYAGKFLVDSNKVCDYNVEEKKFVIVVVKKPKVVVKEEPTESCSDTSHDRMFFRNERSSGGDPEILLCAEHEQLVQHIIELGFSRGQVEAALRASCNNPDQAVEYLINDVIPPSDNEPCFDSARNPDHIADSSDAQLLRHISMSGPPSPGSSGIPNQERIFQLFTEAMSDCQHQTRVNDTLMDEDQELINQSYLEMEASGLTSSSGDFGCAGFMPPGCIPGSTETIPDSHFDMWYDACNEATAMSFAGNLLDEDHEAIDRLKQLGFPDQKVIEAYFVCERNENAAADYLFSQTLE